MDTSRTTKKLPEQLGLGLRLRGGRRHGAGRKPKGDRAGVSHAAREGVKNHPVHVTLRCREGVPGLRTKPMFAVIRRSISAIQERADDRQGQLFLSTTAPSWFRVIHFSVQYNHLHLVVEASDRRALANGVNALCARIAKGINGARGAAGKVFADRYHAHVLRTPRETANAVRYAIHNAISHARRGGDLVDPGWRDPCSSESHAAVVSAPRTWLLRRTG
jgi:REP element-mobilizing transposase RayT